MDLLFAWIASIVSGVEPLVIKASSRSLITNPWLFNVLWVAFGIPLVVVFALCNGAGLPDNWWLIIAMALCSAGFYVFYTLSLYRIDVSTMAPLFSIRTVFVVLLGVVFLHETLNLLSISLIILILLASPFAAYDERVKLRAYLQKPILLAVVAMLSLALMGYFTNRSANVNGYATTLLWQDIFVLLLLLPTLRFANLTKKTVTRRRLIPFMLLGVLGFIFTIAVTKAYAQDLVLSTVIVSLPLSMVFAAALSIKYGKLLERHTLQVYAVRFCAASIMVGAAIVLSLK